MTVSLEESAGQPWQALWLSPQPEVGITGDEHDVVVGDRDTCRQVDGVIAPQPVLHGKPVGGAGKVGSDLDGTVASTDCAGT